METLSSETKLHLLHGVIVRKTQWWGPVGSFVMDQIKANILKTKSSGLAGSHTLLHQQCWTQRIRIKE